MVSPVKCIGSCMNCIVVKLRKGVKGVKSGKGVKSYAGSIIKCHRLGEDRRCHPSGIVGYKWRAWPALPEDCVIFLR